MIRGYSGTLIDMQGAIDMHIHPYPDIFPRLADDVEIALAAREMGFRAVAYKAHHENTVSRAYFTNGLVPGVTVIGGIVLNAYVGGVNPAAAEVALTMGGRIVWLPTVDSPHHIHTHGGSRDLVGLKSSVRTGGVVHVTDDAGRLVPEVHDVLDVIAEHGAVLATSHCSPAEVKLLVQEGRHRGIDRIVLTHPFYKTPGLGLDETRELVRMGAKAEFGYCDYSAMWHVGEVEEVVAAVKVLGAENCVLVSDAGQMHNPLPPECMRLFAQTLYEKGTPEHDISIMIRDVPGYLLNIDQQPDTGTEVQLPHWADHELGKLDPASVLSYHQGLQGGVSDEAH